MVAADKPRENVENLLSQKDFDRIFNEVSVALRPLFECFLTIQYMQIPLTNCSMKPGKFSMQDESCRPDQQAIKRFIAKINLPAPKSIQKYFSGNLIQNRGHGKYLLFFVWHGIKSKTKLKQLGIDTLMMRLAQTVDISEFNDLRNEIKKVCAANTT